MRDDNSAYKIDYEDEGATDGAAGHIDGGPFAGVGDPRLRKEAENAFGAEPGAAAYQAEGAGLSAGSLIQAVIGGLLASVAGGVAWAALVIISGYEVGYAAIGIGALSGATVMFLSRGGRGAAFQVIAVISSVLGVAVGKYGHHFYLFKEMVEKEYGAEAAATVKVLSVGVFQAFLMNADAMLGGFDILWVVLAVITAWKIPSLNSTGAEE